MLIGKLLFSSVILKTKFLQTNEITPYNHFPSSEIIIGGLNEYVCVCLFITNSRVSCRFVFVCSINVSVGFFN